MTGDVVDAWLRRLQGVSGFGPRRALWGETLRATRPAEAAALVDQVVIRAASGDPAAVIAYLPLLDLVALAAATGPGVLGEVLLAARQLDRTGCQLLLEHPGKVAAGEELLVGLR